MTTNTTLLSRMMHGFTSALERSAQRRAQNYLLRLSDAHLADLGLSRDLLRQGPETWPWHKPDDQIAVLSTAAAKRESNTDSDVQEVFADRRWPGMEQASMAGRRDTDTKLAA